MRALADNRKSLNPNIFPLIVLLEPFIETFSEKLIIIDILLELAMVFFLPGKILLS